MSETGDFFGHEAAPGPLQVFHDVVQRGFGDLQDPSALEAQKQLLHDIIEQGTRDQLDPDAQQAIRAYGRILEYLWFEPPDAHPPDEVKFGRVPEYAIEHHGQLLIGADLLSTSIFNEITEILKVGLLPLLALRTHNFEKNEEAVLRAVEAYLATTPVAQTLQRLDSSDPLETRLDAIQLSHRQAIVDSLAHQQVARQHGVASSSLLRVTPGARRDRARGYAMLEDEPGNRKIRQRGRELTQRLATMAVDALIKNNPNLEDAARAQYDRELISFYDRNDVPLAQHELSYTAFLIKDSFPVASTFGVDTISADLLAIGISEAFQALEDGTQRSIYASLIQSYAKTMIGFLQDGFRLRGAGYVQAAMEAIKQPPGMPEVDHLFDGENLDRPPIQFSRSQVFIVAEGRDGDLEKFMEYARRKEKSRAQDIPLSGRVSAAIQGLLQDARQYLVISAEAPNDAVFRDLRQLGRGDPMVECLFTLYDLQANLENSQARANAVAALAKHITYAEGLEALPPELDRPEWYTTPHELARALRRAVEPLIAWVDPTI